MLAQRKGTERKGVEIAITGRARGEGRRRSGDFDYQFEVAAKNDRNHQDEFVALAIGFAISRTSWKVRPRG